MTIPDKFRELLIRCHDQWQRSYDLRDLEGSLIDILVFMKDNINEKSYFIEIMEKIVDGRLDYPIEIVEFSMRYFLWEEIKTYCVDLAGKTNDIDEKNFFQRVVSVYDEDWENRDLYEYYSS